MLWNFWRQRSDRLRDERRGYTDADVASLHAKLSPYSMMTRCPAILTDGEARALAAVGPPTGVQIHTRQELGL